MATVVTEELVKTYQISKKEPGVKGSIKALFSREKSYVQAVKGVNLTIEQGEMVGFLGPNGAGKTTTLKMLSGILYPTSGTARVLGYDPQLREAALLRQISLVMGNKMQLWWDLPAWDSFIVLKELYEVDAATFKKRTEFLIETLGLAEKVHTQVRKLSLGERMKCELVAALLHGPKVVFLDEPTLGLDVVSQKQIRDFLKDLHRRENCTMLLTSHYMQDVEELCERVVVIDHGAIVFEGTLGDLSARFSDTRRIRLTFSQPVTQELVAQHGIVAEYHPDRVAIDVPRAEVARRAARALEALPVEEISIEQVDIEQVIRDLFTKK